MDSRSLYQMEEANEKLKIHCGLYLQNQMDML